MRWKKLGKIFCASEESQAMFAEGRAPVPLHLHDDRFRIFFGACDNKKRSRIFSLEVDIVHPEQGVTPAPTPVIDMGAPGYFDDNGIIPSCIFCQGADVYLYTIGFSVKNKIMFDAAIGLAISRDGGAHFEKFVAPIVDRGLSDPCFATSPSILKEKDLWHMWYVSCDRWVVDETQSKHYYNIKHKTSSDGIYWSHNSTVSIDYANEFEYAVARPCVLTNPRGGYRMWYCFRAQQHIDTYRIGYAESADGITWTRMDHKAGIDVSAEGWDSEMICYPYVFEHKGRLYMLYNGNGYGKSGFGLAVLEEDQTP